MEEEVLILLCVAFNLNLPLLTAWLLDHWLGDPAWLPHPVVAFGKAISFCEHRLNRGDSRFLKGAFVAVSLVLGVYVITLLLLRLAALFSPGMLLTVQILLIFYCLAGTTLVREVRMVFKAEDRSLEDGRMQVARIVGRDTSAISAQVVRAWRALRWRARCGGCSRRWTVPWRKGGCKWHVSLGVIRLRSRRRR